MPKNIPMVDMVVKTNRNFQFISVFPRSPKNPINDFMAMMNNVVATAFFIWIFSNKTKAGIIRKPPPIPKTPVNRPIIIPAKIIKGYLW